MEDDRSRARIRAGRAISAASLIFGAGTITLLCLGTCADVDVYVRGAAGWDFGIMSLLLAEIAASGRAFLWLRARRNLSVRRGLAQVGIILAVVSGTTGVIGYVGHPVFVNSSETWWWVRVWLVRCVGGRGR